MIRIGEYQTLKVVKKVEHGVYLNIEQGCDNDVLLPKRQVPEGIELLSEIVVFIYRDSRDRMIATINKPFITLGELAVLEVKEVNTTGAFLDWGLEKDLLLPYSEQVIKVQRGNKYLIALYIDKSNRLCGTMKVYDYLSTDSNYQKDDTIQGTIYRINGDIGAFVAIDNKYHGLLPRKDITKKHYVGEEVSGRVVEVREDGKLNISIKAKSYLQMDIDTEVILQELAKNEGKLLLNDKSTPEEIKAVFNMSKASFKRSVGRLFKENKIRITDEGIELK